MNARLPMFSSSHTAGQAAPPATDANGPTRPGLVLGPLLRGARPDELSVWVETDSPCTVEVYGNSASTFSVAGHHYGLVPIPPMAPGTTTYEVRLDGALVWPEPPAQEWRPRISIGPDHRFTIMAGSCRQQAPEPLWFRRSTSGFGDLGPDALATLASEIRDRGRTPPDLLLLTGDQVYADEQHRSVRAGLERRRGGPPPPGRPQVTSFEEYSWLYQQTWSHPLIRWLLASVPSLMIFDDHDVIDDWNTSDRWQRDIGSEHWWADRIRAALMSYWVYQHIGNLTPADREADEVYRSVVDAEDGTAALTALADDVADHGPDRLTRTWSYGHRTDLVDLVVLDSRNARVLDPAGRSMLAPVDWSMLDDLVEGADGRHLLVVTSVPWALPTGIHRLQEWVSHLADDGSTGPMSGAARKVGEMVRQGIDLEHWPAFGTSYEDLRDRLERSLDRAATVTVVSGDVHFGYVASVEDERGRPIHQIVASPLRQVELGYERVARRMIMSRAGRRLLDLIAGRTRTQTSATSFDLLDGPIFDNNIATVTYERDRASVVLERALPGRRSAQPHLDRVAERLIGRWERSAGD